MVIAVNTHGSADLFEAASTVVLVEFVDPVGCYKQVEVAVIVVIANGAINTAVTTFARAAFHAQLCRHIGEALAVVTVKRIFSRSLVGQE